MVFIFHFWRSGANSSKIVFQVLIAIIVLMLLINYLSFIRTIIYYSSKNGHNIFSVENMLNIANSPVRCGCAIEENRSNTVPKIHNYMQFLLVITIEIIIFQSKN